MYSEWTNSSDGLPRQGQQIEFILDRRSVALQGTYALQSFHSRWTEYEVDRVHSWRNLSQACELAAQAAPNRKQAVRALSSALRQDPSQHLSPLGRMAHVA